MAEFQQRYPKRLIEVDLPIRTISQNARREKNVRHGHLSTLHLWWARRPLAACRAVVLAALLPDPCDPLCPAAFRAQAAEVLKKLRDSVGGPPYDWNDPKALRDALLAFIGTFSNWDLSENSAFLSASRSLVRAAATSFDSASQGPPLVLDPFAGGGAIPVEVTRIGAQAYATDLNPVAVLLNRVAVEYVPRHGAALVDAVRALSGGVEAAARKHLSEFYPGDKDGSIPVAYLWARTINCEGPGCGTVVPMLRSPWLSKKAGKLAALRLVPDPKRKTISCEITDRPRNVGAGTIRRGSVTCPACGFTTKVDRVRSQLRERHGGTHDAQLLAVVVTRPGETGRFFRLPTPNDHAAIAAAKQRLRDLRRGHGGPLPLVPEESTAEYHSFVNRGPIYGLTQWSDFFTERQLLTLSTLARLVRELPCAPGDPQLDTAARTVLAMAVSRLADICNASCRWESTKTQVRNLFARQAIPMVWDFAEPNVFADAAGNFSVTLSTMIEVLERLATGLPRDPIGHVESANASTHPLPDDSVQAVITDPPYYYSVQYADLSDFFYVWLRRSLGDLHKDLFASALTPKADEIIVQSPGHEKAKTGKNNVHYESRMRLAMQEARRILQPSGIGVVVFAHKSTAGWEAQLQSMIDAGWTITASWPIDTEMGNRVISQGRAVLGSSIHLVCRPREDKSGRLVSDAVGDWREILRELPIRIAEWLPRLAEEGVVGADAIFACLGPALELFSRYARVEKVSGETVPLREYLEQVWAAVSKQAISVVFREAETAGLEPDARLTAMWLWTLGGGSASSTSGDATDESDAEVEDDEEEEESRGSNSAKDALAGFVLEYDAARKIAQGLGANLDDLRHLVEVKADKARLLPVVERTGHLFGKSESDGVPSAKRAAKKKQMTLFGHPDETAEAQGWGDVGAPKAGTTTLDRVHQAMLLFGSGRGEALKRFLVEEGVGKQAQFWKLAQSLSALYPSGSDEKRWVDGVLARKKGLGFG